MNVNRAYLFDDQSLVKTVLGRVLDVRTASPVSPDQAEIFSLKAADIAGRHQPLSSEDLTLHKGLVEAGADQMTCYSAWALYLDYKTHQKNAVN